MRPQSPVLTLVLAVAAAFALSLHGQVVPAVEGGERVTYQGKAAVRVASPPGANTVLEVKNMQFHNGTIEVDIAGRPGSGAAEAARGFAGIAFRTKSPERYECIYLRPANGRADDQVRRNHSVQYVSEPEFPWMRLRKEFPEKYESYADLQPGVWTHYRLVVEGVRARLYLNNGEQPALIVNDLKAGDSTGGIALWAGPGTEAHFANLKVTRGN